MSCNYFFSRTQIPQAVGAAYSLKMDNISACVAAYFGDGSTSEVISAHFVYLFSVPILE